MNSFVLFYVQFNPKAHIICTEKLNVFKEDKEWEHKIETKQMNVLSCLF
jgi:hypothetical protein